MKATFEHKIGTWSPSRTYHRNRVICMLTTVTTSIFPDGVDQMGFLMSVGRNVGDKAWFNSIDSAIGG